MSKAKCWPWSHPWGKWEDATVTFTYPLMEAADPSDPIKVTKQGQVKRCEACGLVKRRIIR